MTVCLVAGLGIGIGIVTGLLGAGPSFLTVLLLVHVAGLSLGGATTTALVVVAQMSLVALVPNVLADTVLWRVAAAIGLPSMAGAYFGGRLSSAIPPRALLVVFLSTMLLAAALMLWERPPPEEREGRGLWARTAVIVVCGFSLGCVTGMVGLGGGFAVVPLLVVFGGVPVRPAIATSLLVISMNTLAGLAGHLPRLGVHWSIAGYLGVAESAGSLLGARFVHRVGVRSLRRGFAALVLTAAVLMLGKAVLA